MKKLFSFAFAVLMPTVMAGLRLDVTNPEFERFQEPIICKLTPEQVSATEGCAMYELGATGRKTAVPFCIAKLDDAAYICWVMDGLTEAGAMRSFILETGKQESDLATDLSIAEDNDRITIGNQFFTTSHRKLGGGSLPQDFKFNLSGNSNPELGLYDRIARPDVPGIFNDRESTAKLIYSSPLMAIVEVHAKYRRSPKAEEDGNPRARYRFFYNCFTPVVQADIIAEHDSETGWKEIHFLHLTHIKKEKYYERVVVGNPAKKFDYLPVGEKSVGHPGQNWGVMEKGPDAVGVGGGIVSTWDAANEFFYYVRLLNIQNFAKKRQTAEGLLYFGQSQQDAAMYSKWLNKNDRPKVNISSGNQTELAELPPMKAPHIFSIGGLRLAFADAKGGFAVLGLEETEAKGIRFLERDEKSELPLWKAEFRAGTDEQSAVMLDSKSGTGTIRQDGEKIVMEWKGLSLGDGAGSADVTATVSVKDRSSDWRIAIKTNSDKYGLWQSEYPILGKVFDATKGSTLLPTGNWGGTLRHNIPCSLNAIYPTTGMPVQFFAFMQHGKGLYIGIHDGLAMHKFANLSIAQALSIKLPAENMGEPGTGREDLFPVRLQMYDGDWWTAAKLYRAWASKQQWTSRGRTFNNPKFPKSLADVSFWTEISATPEQMEKYMIPLAEKAGYPIGVHWYNWNIHRFDTHYPNMLPAKEHMAESTKRMREHNIVVMPYINGRIWDTTIDDFKEALPWACKDEHGKPYMEVYSTSKIELATMCPYTKFYQKVIYDISMNLFNEKHINSLYLDQIGAARPRLCFDKSHGHPMGSGRYWTAGYRELLKPLRKYVDEHGYSLTTENTSEPYMDSIDSYLAWNQREDTDVPVLTAVYSGYTTYFSTPTKPTKDLGLALRTQHGRDFLWGDVVGWNTQWILDAKYKEELDFDLMLGAHRYATREFMAHGELLGDLLPTESVPYYNVTWQNRSPHEATMPAVQGTIWEAMDGRRCVYILNYEDRVQSFSFNLPVPAGGNSWLVRRITPNGNAPCAFVDSKNLDWTAHLNSRELLVLSMENASGKAKDYLKEANAIIASSNDDALKNAASQFIFSQNCRAILRIGTQLEFVQGEFADVDYTIENAGEATELEITWPNGLKEKKSVPAKGSKQFTATLDMSKMESGNGNIIVSNGKASYSIPIALSKLPPVSAEIRLPNNVFSGESTHALLLVSNNSSETKDATLFIRAPENWTISPSRNISLQNLKSKSKRCFNLDCIIGEQQEDSSEQLQVMVQYEIGGAKVPVLKTRPKVVGHAATIKIDGKLDDWTQTDIITIDESCKDKIFYKNKGQEYGGSADCAAKCRVAWDTNYLYFAFDVTDDVHINPSRDTKVWNGDMIQLALRPGGPAEKSNDTTARQFAFACDEKGGFMFQWNMFANDGTSGGDGVQENCKIVCARGENGNVIYEAAVPWRTIQLEPPKPNARFGFSFVVSDNDEKNMKGWLQLSPGIFGGHNPASLGWLILKK